MAETKCETCLHAAAACLQGNPGRTYMWAALMFLFPLIGAVCYVHSSRLAIISQIRIRAQLTSLVYRKALALSSRSALQCMQHSACNEMRPVLPTCKCARPPLWGDGAQDMEVKMWQCGGMCYNKTLPAGSVPPGWVHFVKCSILRNVCMQAGCMRNGQKG